MVRQGYQPRESLDTSNPPGSRYIQLHVGKDRHGEPVWYTDSEGNYWCGNWYHRTPEQLLLECSSIIADLVVNHPELVNQIIEKVRGGK